MEKQKKNEFQPLALRSLYTIGEVKIVVPEGVKKGTLNIWKGIRKKIKIFQINSK
jgi:hypothetical protein